MPDRSCRHRDRSTPARQDQAAGLRRLFAPSEPQWLPVLLAPGRDLDNAGWLADLAQACVDQGARTLVVDAARAHIARAFGARARYDLAHAFSGDCAPFEACVAGGANLRILPAVRALEQSARAPGRVRHFEAGVRALAATADTVLLVLPALHARSLAGFCGTGGMSDAIVVFGPGSGCEGRVIETMRSILSVAEIDTFRLLFQGTDRACAGRLYSSLAAIGARELGARTSDAGSVNDAAAIGWLVRQLRCRNVPRGDRADGDRRGAAVETVS
ncbi:MAG TPA: hypothetical protein VNW98_09020 [Burkholderiaceae bacterium]|jgi:hypothetical protein|nr:hypothetical protein [Burkholderiaceae bacterium]